MLYIETIITPITNTPIPIIFCIVIDSLNSNIDINVTRIMLPAEKTGYAVFRGIPFNDFVYAVELIAPKSNPINRSRMLMFFIEELILEYL
jgi:hypothetical protein